MIQNYTDLTRLEMERVDKERTIVMLPLGATEQHGSQAPLGTDMMIAGAIAGLAGGLLYLAGTGKHIEVKDVLGSEGFTGISVALLGLSHPIGVLFSGLFIAYLTAGGFYLQLFEFSTEIIDIIVAVIIYFSAFALIVKTLLAKIKQNKAGKEGGDEA